MPNLPRFLAHFSQNYKIFAKNLRFRIRRFVLERVSRALRRAQNIFMPKNINCITIVISIEKMKTETKMTTRQFEEYFFHRRCQKTSTNTVMASRFWLAVYIAQLFDSHFSLVSFSRLKYILARQILHFSPQNALQDATLMIIRNIPITPKTVYFKSGLQAYMFFVVTKWRRPLLIFCLERKGELKGSI